MRDISPRGDRARLKRKRVADGDDERIVRVCAPRYIARSEVESAAVWRIAQCAPKPEHDERVAERSEGEAHGVCQREMRELRAGGELYNAA